MDIFHTLNEFDKNPKNLLKIFVVSLLAFYVFFDIPIYEDVIAGGWDVCLTYLGEGSLYGGQPFCNQAPLIYHVGFVSKMVFGVQNMWVGSTLLKAMLLISVFLMTHELSHRKNLFLTSGLFFMVFYPMAVNKPEMLFSTAFFLAGFILQHRVGRSSHAGVAYALAVFFKYTAILPIAISILYENKSPKDMAKMAVPSFALAILFYVLYPNYLIYSLWAHMLDPAMSYLDATVLFFTSTNVHFLALYGLIIVFGYLALLSDLKGLERLIFFIPLVCLPAVSFGLTRANGELQLPTYYALHSIPLLIAASHILLKRRRDMFILVVGLVLIYPSFLTSNPLVRARGDYLSQEMDEFDNLILSGLSVLEPPQNGLLLETSKEDIKFIDRYGINRFFEKYGWRVDSKDNTFIHSGSDFQGAEDSFWAPRVRKMINITLNYSRSGVELSEKSLGIKQNILDGKYDTIMVTAKSWTGVLGILDNISGEYLADICFIHVPDFTHKGKGKMYSVIFYDDKEKCKNTSVLMAKHYSSKFDSICSKSWKAAAMVKHVNEKNRVRINKECNSHKELSVMDPRNPQMIDVPIIAAILACLWILTKKDVGNPGKNSTRKKQ